MNTNPVHPRPKFVVYRRVSTREQGSSGLGLAGQTQLLEHYLQGYEVVAEFEEVASAKDLDGRPKLRDAVALCVANGYHLAVAKVDRLSRKTEDALAIWNKLGGRLFCADLPMQPTDLTDKFTLTIFLAIADREREMISIRTRQALAAKRARDGEWFQEEWSNLDQEARQRGADTMRRRAIKAQKSATYTARMLRDSGMTYAAIAEKLNANGYKTRRGKEYLPMTVKRMLDRVAQEEEE